MTEDQNAQLARDAGAHEPVEATGNEAVDRVLESLDALVDTPVAGHVAIFEAAHDHLRGALADAGNTEPALG